MIKVTMLKLDIISITHFCLLQTVKFPAAAATRQIMYCVKKQFTVLIFLIIILKCSSHNFEEMCKRTADGDMNFHFKCTCTKQISVWKYF